MTIQLIHAIGTKVIVVRDFPDYSVMGRIVLIVNMTANGLDYVVDCGDEDVTVESDHVFELTSLKWCVDNYGLDFAAKVVHSSIAQVSEWIRGYS